MSSSYTAIRYKRYMRYTTQVDALKGLEAGLYALAPVDEGGALPPPPPPEVSADVARLAPAMAGYLEDAHHKASGAPEAGCQTNKAGIHAHLLFRDKGLRRCETVRLRGWLVLVSKQDWHIPGSLGMQCSSL